MSAIIPGSGQTYNGKWWKAPIIYGAMGYMRETGIEKLMRDAKMLQIVEGANEVQKGIIARAILQE